MQLVTGLHHITALASDPQKTVNFYAGILGLRLVKKTINFDAPDVYHLYFGNKTGAPGTILTFFPYMNIPQGRKGKGQLTVTSFSIPEHSLEYWMKRLDEHGIAYRGPAQRFDERLIYFEDHDGLGLELVANKEDKREGSSEHAIKGFYGMTLSEECYERTAALLIHMDHAYMGKIENRLRYSASGKPGDFVDILCNPDALSGIGGYGTVHHVAFATASDVTQLDARAKLMNLGFDVTPVMDRQYFHSIYFREPGGVLFEIATVPPGFTVDERLEHLGESLKLPAWEEPNRARIEKRLPLLYL